MGWTTQDVTTVTSIAALMLGMINLGLVRRAERRRNELQDRNDRADADRLLDQAFDALYGPDGYTRFAEAAKLDIARLAIERAARLAPGYARVIQYEGYLMEAQGNMAAARLRYEHAVAQDSGQVNAYRGLARLTQGDAAISILEKAIAHNPSYASELRYDFAKKYEAMGRGEEALVQYQRALSERPRHLDALTGMASLLLGMGRRNDAVSALEKAIAFNPASVTALVGLGRLAIEDGEWDSGVALINRAMAADPRDDYPYMMLAAIYADRKEPELALEWYEKARQINPGRHVDDVGRDLAKAMKELIAGRDDTVQRKPAPDGRTA